MPRPTPNYGSTKIRFFTGGERVEKYKKLIKLLKADGTLDGVGMQGHWLEKVPTDTIQNTLDQMAELQLPLYITEYEVHEADDKQQRAIWAAQFPVMWEHPAIKGVTPLGLQAGANMEKRCLPDTHRWQRTPGDGVVERIFFR